MMRPCTYKPSLRFLVDPDPSAGGAAAAADGVQQQAQDPPAATAAAAPAAGGEQDDDEPLGEAGKKALDAMKLRAREAEKTAREAAAELARVKAEQEGKAAEYEQQQAADKVRADALAAANTRILKAEVRALAASRLADPEDALRFLDLTDFDVTDTGDVDRAAITAAIESLVTSKPYLSAQGGGRFQGAGDGGARNAQKPSQISEAELAQMSPEQINKARREGRLDRLMGKTA